MRVEAGEDFLDFGEEVSVCFVRHAWGGVVGKRGAAHRDGDSRVGRCRWGDGELRREVWCGERVKEVKVMRLRVLVA